MRTKGWQENSPFKEVYTQRKKKGRYWLYMTKPTLYRHSTLSIRLSIYTTNLIENFNKQIKSQCKEKSKIPNEASLERFICGLVLEYNRESEERVHKGFLLAQPQLTDLFS